MRQMQRNVQMSKTTTNDNKARSNNIVNQRIVETREWNLIRLARIGYKVYNE